MHREREGGQKYKGMDKGKLTRNAGWGLGTNIKFKLL